METLELIFRVQLKDGRNLECGQEFDFDPKDMTDKVLVVMVLTYMFNSLHEVSDGVKDVNGWGVMCNYPFEWLVKADCSDGHAEITFGCRNEEEFKKLESYIKIFRKLTRGKANRYLH